MELDREHLFKMMRARDKRMDGRIYVGVHTTGIYCRPICPARPQLKNISFYRSQAEAEKLGFRPCLRCRPELSPQSVQWQGTGAVLSRALHLIARGDADEGGLESLASRLGLSDRHLRRVFEEHLGASPVEVALSKRLHLAKQLLLETKMSVTEIVYASGFQSIRRFNDAFRKVFKKSPSQWRKDHIKDKTKKAGAIFLELPYIAPYDWTYLHHFLKNHCMSGVEVFEREAYRRVFEIEKKMGWFEVENDLKKIFFVLKLKLKTSQNFVWWLK